jgi:hypothetical protein
MADAALGVSTAECRGTANGVQRSLYLAQVRQLDSPTNAGMAEQFSVVTAKEVDDLAFDRHWGARRS